MNLIDSNASLQSSHGFKLNTIAWVVELTYLQVVVKRESLLGGQSKAGCSVTLVSANQASLNSGLTYRVFSCDVTTAMLVSLNNGTTASCPLLFLGELNSTFVLAEKPAHRSREPKYHSNINRRPISSIIGNSLTTLKDTTTPA